MSITAPPLPPKDPMTPTSPAPEAVAPAGAPSLERAAADNVKRVLRPAGAGQDAVEPDWARTPDLSRMRAFLETKTVWHPKGR